MNTLQMEGAPSAWCLAMQTLQATYTRQRTADDLMCTRCLELKDTEEFYSRKSASGNRCASVCRSCHMEKQKEYRATRAARIAAGELKPSKSGRLVVPGSVQSRAREAGIAVATVRYRMGNGMTLEQALSYPATKTGKGSK